MELNQIIHGDCQPLLNLTKSGSYDCILTDPPYLYLKGQKLERVFDEQMFFTQCRRVLKPNGFLVIFGRGKSFYRWSNTLSEMGFSFKEEIIWDKGQCSSPLLCLSRVHETIAIFTKGKGVLNRVKVPYLEMKQHDIGGIIQDIKRMKAILHNTKSLDAVLSFLQNNALDADTIIRSDFQSSAVNKQKLRGDCNDGDRACNVLQSVTYGMNEKSIIRTDRTADDKFTKHGVATQDKSVKSSDRCCNVMQGLAYGMNEKSIIKQVRDHYSAIHPTQKPVRLLERLLALTTKPGDLVLDPFSGSGATAEACLQTGRNFTAFEIDQEYYKGSIERIYNYRNAKVNSQLKIAV